MPIPTPIRALIVETSTGRASRLPHDLAEDAELSVVGTAAAGNVLDKLERYQPDVVAVDLQLPGETGFQAIRQIMTNYPLPVVVVGEGGTDGSLNFAALEAGALAVVQRPIEVPGAERDAQIAALAQTLKLMSEVRVVRRRQRMAAPATLQLASAPEATVVTPVRIRLIAIGASTGGPAVLQTILGGLAGDFPVPVVIVQHITAGFVSSMVEWLQMGTALRLHVAEHNEPLLPGHVYFAPDQRQMGVNGSHVVLGPSEQEDGHCPAVSYLFRSVAKTYGRSAVGVLLTGMGKDGAAELLQMRRQGSITIAQERESCIVYGMPGRAEDLDAVTHYLPPDKIAPVLTALATQNKSAATALGADQQVAVSGET